MTGMNTIRTWLLGLAVLGVWLFPSPGVMGFRTSLGLLLVMLIAGRFPRGIHGRAYLLITAGLVAFSPGDITAWKQILARVLAVSAFMPPITVIRATGWLLLSALIVAFPAWGWLVIATATGIALRKIDCHPPVSTLRFAILCAFISSVISMVLVTCPRIPLTGGDNALRWGIAEVLNRRNPRVRLKRIFDTLQDTVQLQRGNELLTALDEVEGRLGNSPDIATLRIITLDAVGMREKARALFVESARYNRAIPAQILSWFPHRAPWIPAASYLNTGTPDSRRVLLGFDTGAFRDSISVEYAARTLLECGFSAEACTLTHLSGFQNQGWARYIMWRSRSPRDRVLPDRMIADTTLSTAGHAFILLRGEPARGEWPEFLIRCNGHHVTGNLNSEFPVAVPMRGVSCSVTFLNDIRSYRDDRNLIYSGMIQGDVDHRDAIDGEVESLWNRIAARVGDWNLASTDTFDICDTGLPPWARIIPPTEMKGAVPDTVGYLISSLGQIRWKGLAAGRYAVIMRAEPGGGRWPVVEHGEGVSTIHMVIDSWDWEHFTMNHPSREEDLTIRFVDDYYSEGMNEDRNVWFACLYHMPGNQNEL